MKISFLKILSSKGVRHLGFWVSSFYAIGTFFSISNTPKFIDFYYALFFHVPLVVLVYLNLRLLVPYFLKKKKYLYYTFLAFANIGLVYLIHELVFEIILPILPTEYYMVSFTDLSVLISIFLIYTGLTSLLTLSKSWYQLQQLEKEKLETELNSLKAQINPHFLFNSLNSIYSLALSKDERTPKLVLELSSIMKYMLYEVSEDLTPLQKEVEMLKDYIHLQKIRSDDSAQIQFEITGELTDKLIPPLLLFPLVENAFKHGVMGASDSSFVKIRLGVNNDIRFSIKNNQGSIDDVEKKKYGGIGLENVSKRMQLIYGNSASMDITNEVDYFEVKIKLPI